MNTTSSLPPHAWVVALLTLPKLGPRRLSQLLETGSAHEVWTRLKSTRPVAIHGVSPKTIETWRTVARSLSVEDHWAAMHNLGVRVMVRGEPGYPDRLEGDIDPPAVLFALGDADDAVSSKTPTVGIVGTRRSTSYGKRVAFELGAALAESGVSVVSGLALGIDAAAHRGALSSTAPLRGRSVGVVGSGLDIIYPRANADLWGRITAEGLLLSETPPGVAPDRWRFPARNRIIAAMCDAVVVVESHERGGSLITVDEAQARDVPVGAVPGPVTSNSAGGSNRLLVDGATPVLDVTDVHALIGYSPPRQIAQSMALSVQSELLDVLGWTPLSFDQVCSRIALPVADIATELERLVEAGLCQRSGTWIERVR